MNVKNSCYVSREECQDRPKSKSLLFLQTIFYDEI